MKTNKRIVIGSITLLILVIVGAGFVGQSPGRNYFKAKRVSRIVLGLPSGTSQAQVFALLESEGLEYSFVDKQGNDVTIAVSNSSSTAADLSGYAVAMIRNTSGGFIVSGDVQYYFFFDRKGKLYKATAKDVFTGP